MKWRHVIKEDLTKMIQKNVLSPLKPEDEHYVTIPLVMCWFLILKDNRRYRSILVAKVFLQR